MRAYYEQVLLWATGASSTRDPPRDHAESDLPTGDGDSYPGTHSPFPQGLTPLSAGGATWEVGSCQLQGPGCSCKSTQVVGTQDGPPVVSATVLKFKVKCIGSPKEPWSLLLWLSTDTVADG